jgi:membrane associated rhomboid family serine protease
MLPILVFLTVVCGLVLRKMEPEERIQLFQKILQHARQFSATFFTVLRSTPSGCEEFYSALQARTRWAIITPLIVAMSAAVHLFLWNSGAHSNDQLLVEWGASFGPRTTNGGWWRLAAAMFIHRGWTHLIADMAGLVMAGALIERVVGRAAFSLVFAASGLIAGLFSLASHPISVSTGAAGAVFGVYGLLAATMIWGFAQRSPLTIPLAALRRAGLGAFVFVIYHVATEGFGSATMQAGLGVGLVSGLILAARVSAVMPPLGRVCATSVATFALLVAFAAPLRGIADVESEVARVIDVEKRTAARYDAEAAKFRRGTMSAERLASVAERIGAEVQTVRAEIATLKNVPPEQVPLCLHASEYLRLRDESWRLRVDALRQGRMKTLQLSSEREIEALRAFAKLEERP